MIAAERMYCIKQKRSACWQTAFYVPYRYAWYLIAGGNLQIHPEEAFGQNADEERNHRNADADNGHFPETRLKRLILRDRGVIGKARNDKNDDPNHHGKRREWLGEQ